MADEGLLLGARASSCPPPPVTAPPPFGDMPSILDSLTVSLGSLKAALGTVFPSSFPLPSGAFFEKEDDDWSREDLPLSRSLSLDVALLSESFRVRSRCSLVALWALRALLLPLPPSLLDSYNKNFEMTNHSVHTQKQPHIHPE